MPVERQGTLANLVSLGLFLALIAASGCARSGAGDEEHRKMAIEYASQGNISVAIQQLERINRPTSDDYAWRGELLTQRGRASFGEAAAAFQEALKIDKRSSRALYGLGLLSIFEKEFAKAEKLFREVLTLQPGAPHARNLLAGALIYQERYEEAEALLVALETEPTMAVIAKGNLGELYFRQKRLDLAEAKLREAMTRQPDNFDWHRWLGEVYRAQGKNEAAIIEYRRALHLLENSQWADAALIEQMRARIRELER